MRTLFTKDNSSPEIIKAQVFSSGTTPPPPPNIYKLDLQRSVLKRNNASILIYLSFSLRFINISNSVSDVHVNGLEKQQFVSN